MSFWFTGGVAAAYAASVVGVHRWSVSRRVRLAQGFPTLAWIDWDTLLEGTLPGERRGEPSRPSGGEAPGPSPLEGGPPPRLLAGEGGAASTALLRSLVAGAPVDPDGFRETDFGGGGARWLTLLAWLRPKPRDVLERLEASPPTTAAEAYLREHLTLTLDAGPLTLEWLVFASKRRCSEAIARFGDRPALYFARAKASALLGFQGAVLDDLARAVYFSREAPFYLQAVTQWAAVRDLRPALSRACQEAELRQ